MATDKRKRAIRALATQHGISYTAAMRLHDSRSAPPEAAGGEAVTIDFTPYRVAGQAMYLDRPLAVYGDVGSGALALVCDIATQAALKGADVRILSEDRTIMPLGDGAQLGSSVATVSTWDSRDPQAAHAAVLDLLDEVARRLQVLSRDPEAGTWRALPDATKRAEGIVRPILLLEDTDRNPEGSWLSDSTAHALRQLRRTGRAAGLTTVSLRSIDGPDAAAHFLDGGFEHAVFYRLAEPGPELTALVDALAPGATPDVLRAFRSLRTGQAVVMEQDGRVLPGQFDPSDRG